MYSPFCDRPGANASKNGSVGVSSSDSGSWNIQRIHLDPSPIDLDIGGIAVCEELAPVIATCLER